MGFPTPGTQRDWKGLVLCADIPSHMYRKCQQDKRTPITVKLSQVAKLDPHSRKCSGGVKRRDPVNNNFKKFSQMRSCQREPKISGKASTSSLLQQPAPSSLRTESSFFSLSPSSPWWNLMRTKTLGFFHLNHDIMDDVRGMERGHLKRDSMLEAEFKIFHRLLHTSTHEVKKVWLTLPLC